MQDKNKGKEGHGLRLQWMDFNSHKDNIQQLRRTVFVEEQGFDDFVLESPLDEMGLHLGLYSDAELVSCISIFPYEKDDDYIRGIPSLKSNRPFLIQFSRRVQHKDYRSHGFSKLISAHAVRSAYELFLPDCIFATVLGVHAHLKNFYIKNYAFNYSEPYTAGNEEGYLLIMNKQKGIDQLAAFLRTESIKISRELDLPLPDLTHHIMQHKHLRNYMNATEDHTNRYLKHLSLNDELPRLSAQARMLFKTQRDNWLELLREYPQHHKILDMGCGPGIYLSQVARLEETKDRSLMGMDISPDFITYARFSHPGIDWKNGSIYDTGLEAESVDVVHCSLVFIHLMNPFRALKEIYRILAPGGIFYISDVNDETFQGPEVIKSLIEAHDEIYEGNRKIMSSINELAEKAGFTLSKSDTLLADNTGSEGKMELNDRHFKIGKWAMWGIFTFLGQREEVIDQYHAADKLYSNSDSHISIEIQSRIFKK